MCKQTPKAQLDKMFVCNVHAFIQYVHMYSEYMYKDEVELPHLTTATPKL